MKNITLKSNMWAFIALTIVLALWPSIYESRSLLILLTQVFIFAGFAMSYDLLLGYTGIVSFGHAMFFGIGAYMTAVFMKQFEPTVLLLILSVLAGILVSAIVSYLVGLLTLRLKSHFYAMLTLALSGLFLVLAEKWRTVTYGNDGFTFSVPDFLKDRTLFYLICLGFMVLTFLFLRRFTLSPLGRVLQGIRENEQRIESLGFHVIQYKIVVSVVAGVVASLAGALYGLSLRYVNTSVFAIDITLDALLMTIIGGVGTLVGAIIGSGFIEFTHHWLSDLADVHWIFERWIILFGILYILAVIFFPQGIVGAWNGWRARRTAAKKSDSSKVSIKKQASS